MMMKLIENRRLRLIFSIIIASIVFLVGRTQVTSVVAFMLTWIAFATANLVFSWIVILAFHPKEVKAIADKEDASGTFIFLFVLLAASVSLFAIIFLLMSVPDSNKQGLSTHIILSFASVFCSWTLVHTLFTLRYARLYYKQPATSNKTKPGLSFPEEDDPDYLDFAYFSFVLGMTFQVSDVSIQSKQIRRLALLHSFLSFIYNTVIVALSINILSGVISK